MQKKREGATKHFFSQLWYKEAPKWNCEQGNDGVKSFDAYIDLQNVEER